MRGRCAPASPPVELETVWQNLTTDRRNIFLKNLLGAPPYQLPNDVVDRIGAMAGLPVLSDAPRRVMDVSFVNSNRLWKWKTLTRDGKHHLTQESHRAANASVGSAFNEPIVTIPCPKENDGVIHTPAGHTNHFWVSVGNAIKMKMKDCPWQARLSAIDDEVSTEKRTVEGKMKLVGVDSQLNIIKSKIRRLRRDAKREREMHRQWRH